MREETARHLANTAKRFRQEETGDRVTLRWRGDHSGVYDGSRGEYETESGELTLIEQNVSCLVYQIKGTFEQQEWGDAEVGDIIIGLDPQLDTTNMYELEVLYQKGIWEVVPDSRIPAERLAGVVAGRPLAKVLHCRYRGAL